jgi:membrane-associated phospholipid phosphatase
MAANQYSQSAPSKELHDSAWSVRRRWTWSAPAIAALVFVLILVVTHGGGIAGTPYWPAQQTVFLKMNAWLSTYPAWMWSGLTLMGDSIVLFSMLAMFVLRKPQVFVAVLASVPVGGLFSAVVKHWAGVLRPPAVLDPTLFTLIGPALQLQSFPSGHSITAFAAAAFSLR